MTWADYFDACKRNDIWAAFEALAGVGVLPVVNGPDSHGKIKRPLANAWQTVTTQEWSAKLTAKLQSGDAVGIGAKPVGYLVMDVDPADKDRRNLAVAWKEASQLVFGADDPPKTLTVATEAGCHVWFNAPAGLTDQWSGTGKKVINLKSGGKLELYVGISDGGYQVACAPSEGKTIAIGIEPIDLPRQAVDNILRLTTSPPKPPERTRTAEPASVDSDFEWIRNSMASGYLDSELDDYESWLKVGMALHDKFGSMGADLWESWSSRHSKHVDHECYTKVRSFKRATGNVVRFGSLVAIVQRNGGPKPQKASAESKGEPEIDPVTLNPEIEAADVNTILDLMKERSWLWGNPAANLGWLVKRGLHLIEGKEGTGKTRFIMDLVRRWSFCLPWPDGSEPTIDQDSKVLFVAADSHFDQIAETAVSFGIPPENVIFTGPEQAPYEYTSLDDPMTIRLIRHWCERYKVGLVVIDTLMAASSLPLVDPQEVAKLARPLRDLARELNVAIVLVGHLNSQGETWGRAMGRQCDNVIRMEASENDRQEITIKSVKARWNLFALPTIKGRQSESGWEYSTIGSDAGDKKVENGRKAAEIATINWLNRVGKSAWSDIQGELQECGYSKSTINRALKSLVASAAITEWEETFGSGSKCTFYAIPHSDSEA